MDNKVISFKSKNTVFLYEFKIWLIKYTTQFLSFIMDDKGHLPVLILNYGSLSTYLKVKYDGIFLQF